MNGYTEKALDWLRDYIEWAAREVGGQCESPIEDGLLRCFIAMRLADRRFRVDGLRSGPILTDWEAVIYPQHRVAGYRLDFAVKVENGTNVSWIAVECDGHDFHERTKEQAARDKARDRFLTTAGFRILRFTGSEIYANPMGCALQVSELAAKIVEGWE
ncbi:endonuclease domain-containing protein [Sphingomonas segetis]|uniref:endonuclease domain-containing protein n=1 Tax=Sphingomonas segetis TaxID=1104779 RepID=UPI0012D306F2|nr:DUF559 domain-containing protein [Sphingomonas segetis]